MEARGGLAGKDVTFCSAGQCGPLPDARLRTGAGRRTGPQLQRSVRRRPADSGVRYAAARRRLTGLDITL